MLVENKFTNKILLLKFHQHGCVTKRANDHQFIIILLLSIPLLLLLLSSSSYTVHNYILTICCKDDCFNKIKIIIIILYNRYTVYIYIYIYIYIIIIIIMAYCTHFVSNTLRAWHIYWMDAESFITVIIVVTIGLLIK